MQQELTDLLPVLADSQEKTNILMETIEKKLPGVQQMQKTVGDEAAVVQVEADKCNAMKSECEAELRSGSNRQSVCRSMILTFITNLSMTSR